jgi:hypothetical protein
MKLRHWEYSFILATCNLVDRVRMAANPFTGGPIEFPIDDGLTVAERDGIRRVFARYGVQGPEADGEGYALYLPENGSVRFRGGPDLEDSGPRSHTGFAVEIVVKDLIDNLLTFVLDVARQGNLAFMSSTGRHVRLVQESNDPKIKKRWPKAAMMPTTDALRTWLQNQIGGREVHLS